MTDLIYSWNHLPHWVRAMIVGNLIQAAAVALLRMLRERYVWLAPLFDRVGPKSLRAKTSNGGCLLIWIFWFVLSWKVGHWAMWLRSRVVAWMVAR